jgi:hypothetical protein
MAWLSADCETPSLAAARVKLLSLATARKAVRSARLFRAIDEFRSYIHAGFSILSQERQVLTSFPRLQKVRDGSISRGFDRGMNSKEERR